MTSRHGSAVVLCYHHVADGDPLGLSVHPDHFAEQVARLPSVADVVPLADIQRRAPGPRVALTFDDAYADTGECAAPMLEAAGLPVTIFVPTATLQPNHEFWWERLVHLVLDLAKPDQPALEIELAGHPLRSDVRTAEGRMRTFHALNNRFVGLEPNRIEGALEVVAMQLGGSVPRRCPLHRKLTPEQVRTLGARERVEIGGHSRTHALLSSLDEDTQRSEIAGGRRDLDSLLPHPVTSFAYPYGYPGSFDKATRQIVRDAGYARACTTIADQVTRRTDAYRIPRYQVQDWNGDGFETTVVSWLAA